MCLRPVIAIVAAAALAPAQNSGGDIYKRTHEALFASFLPVSELGGDLSVSALLTAAREGIWNGAQQNPQFRQLLAPFTDLTSLEAICHVGTDDTPGKSHAYADMTPAQRERRLKALEGCPNNDARRLASNVRSFYVVKGYGAIQEQLTGVKVNLYAPESWTRRNTPALPPTRLRYDAPRHEITRADGPIDYLIVGSGPAGSVLAHELRRGGRRVVLIEKGSLIVPGSMETRLIDDLIDTRTTDDGAIRVRNGMAAGGGSQVNVDLCFAPTLPSVLARIDGWRKAGRIGESDFTKHELAREYEWVKSAVGTRQLSEGEINVNNRALWDGAKRAGLHPSLYDLNTYAPGKSPYPVTDKRSSESQLLIEALQDHGVPLSMLPDADVRRVIFEGDRAAGVEVRMRTPASIPGVLGDINGLRIAPGAFFTLHARNIILSAGALGSPAILLRSGVKNDQIGRGIVLHPSMPIMGLFDDIVDALKGTEASVYVGDRLLGDGYALESMSDQPLYAALMSPGPPMHAFQMVRSYRRLAGFGVMLIDTPAPDNRLTLDQNGEPVIHYALSESDKARFRHGIAEAIRIMFLAGAKQVYLPTTEDVLGNGASATILTRPEQAASIERNLRFTPNQTIVTSAHMQATNKMGRHESDSVVSNNFEVFGRRNLYIVDGSVFPTSIGANPMQSIYTFAKIFADRINRGHKD
jgi:choline dehydrogenase-like flavoprotein